MITNGTHNARFLDLDKPTDMEVAISISRMLDNCRNSAGEADQAGWRETVISMAKNVLNGLTNPFAKKLLADRIGE